MTKLLLTFFVCHFCFLISAQDFFGIYQNKRVPYYMSENRLLVKFRNNEISNAKLLNNPLVKSVTPPNNVGAIFVDLKSPSKDRVTNLIEILNSDPEIEYATPVLINSEGVFLGCITNEFVVKLKDNIDFETFDVFLRKNNCQISRRYEFDNKTFSVKIVNPTKSNAPEKALEFYLSGFFEYAEPDYLVPFLSGTNDPSYNSQWVLNNTGQSGGSADADIDTLEAWQYTAGCNSVRVAVLDSGIELNHPDLVNNLLPGFDATGGGSNGGNTGNDWHGTHCAGIIGATANNGIGIAGIAYNARIVPVMVITDATSNTDLAALTVIAAGVDWVRVYNTAEIISMSFGTIFITSQTLANAINSATTTGRNGLGIVVVAITQNNGTNTIAFPANLENVIAVGSVDHNGIRASTSNYGTGIDLVVP